MRKALTTLAVLVLSVISRAGDITVLPGQSIHHALRQAREWRRTHDPRCDGGIHIHIKAGRYHMEEPLLIRPEDSGTASSPTLISGETGTIICGDEPQRHTQLFPQEGMERIIGFDADARTITIPTPPRRVLRHPHLELLVAQRWATAILRVKDYKVNGSHTILTFREPESRIEFEHPWPQPVVGGERGNSAFLLRTTEQREGIERLVVVSGTEEYPVAHVTLQGLTFEHTCWNRPLRHGHVTLQGGFPLIDAYKLQQEGLPWASTLENQAWVERPVAAVSISGAEHVDVKDCTFSHLASTALDYGTGIRHCTISGNTFTHIGGTAILAGSFAEWPREVHHPYDDLAPQCYGLTIVGNKITHCATEDWGAVAIGCGYVSHTTIEGNSVSGTNYSGICVGWGWTPLPTRMTHNRIERNTVTDYARQLYDAGAIYTLSRQDASTIIGNKIGRHQEAPYATNERCFAIYLDAETDGFHIEGNTWDDGEAIGQDAIGLNHPGKHIIFGH